MTVAGIVVGTGFGARIHVAALRAAGIDVCALVGRDAERTSRRAERAGVRVAETSLTAAIERARDGATDAPLVVTIATPPDSHASLALEAVSHGCHVICEKPFTMNAEEALRLADAVEEARVIGVVGHEFRWAPERATVARVIAGGMIGEPRLFASVNHIGLLADPAAKMPDWWFDASRGGGWVGASGSHLVDQVRASLGEVRSVSATITNVARRHAGGAEDSFTVRVSLASGAEGLLQQSAASWGPPSASTRVIGTAGSVWVDGPRVWVADRSGERQVEIGDDLAVPSPAPSDDPRHRYTHLELGPYTKLARWVAEAIDGAQPWPPPPTSVPGAVPWPATFADGARTMQVLDAIRRSAANGGETTAVA